MDAASSIRREEKFHNLVDLLHSIPESIFDPFDISRTVYKSADLDIPVDILIPKAETAVSTRPIIVRIHGGFLITGGSLFPGWFSKWVLDYAEVQSAVIVSPDYRLLPEARGTDILYDIGQFWKWLYANGPTEHLASIGRDHVRLNYNELLLVGESAGGYLSIQSVLLRFAAPSALICLYPMLDMKADHYTKGFSKPLVMIPNYGHETVDALLFGASERDAVTAAHPPERLRPAIAAVQTGRYLEFLGNEPELFVLEEVQRLSEEGQREGRPLLPPLLLLHGKGDSVVPIEGTYNFLRILKRFNPQTTFRLEEGKGDHGFDATANLRDGWLRECLDWIEPFWLGKHRHSQL